MKQLIFVALTLPFFSGAFSEPFSPTVRVSSSLWPNARLQADRPQDRERAKAYAREQFTKNFRTLQLVGQGLLREHESNRLNKNRLAKDAKTVNRCAKILRELMALGNLADAIEVNKEINTPEEFDQSIRQLSKLIWDFAHNPHHQNNKIFDTDLATRAQTDLLTIIDLSRAIEEKAKGYTPYSSLNQ